MGSAPCYVVAFTARQLGQLLSGLKSLACSGSLCIKNRSCFTLYPTRWLMCHSVWSDDGSSKQHLQSGSADSTSSLIPVGFSAKGGSLESYSLWFSK